MAFDKDWNVDKSIPQPDVLATQDAKFVKSFQEYTLSNPHPGYGKDPNIINEYGHTLYPKWVTDKKGDRVIVNTPMEEAEVTGKDGTEASTKKDSWS